MNKPISLDSPMVANWQFDSGPVSVLNPDSTLHERAAWCWQQVVTLNCMLNILATGHNDPEIRSLVNIVQTFTDPLESVLETVGDKTNAIEQSSKPVGVAA